MNAMNNTVNESDGEMNNNSNTARKSRINSRGGQGTRRPAIGSTEIKNVAKAHETFNK